ncbi:hypothetical protein HSEST_0660 [Halapricum desulfuricans]|uniref:Uncharacterized protein n=1 Tax=Halapricum desulfuricans TaxID=2841257 RepID=A0A897NRW8_9EURY|nr:hypothetical protein HSEST_0660 [Halapricum desulfuricans]
MYDIIKEISEGDDFDLKPRCLRNTDQRVNCGLLLGDRLVRSPSTFRTSVPLAAVLSSWASNSPIATESTN